MRKLFVLAIALVSFVMNAQGTQRREPKVNMDINPELYPLQNEGGRFSDNPEATLQSLYYAAPYDVAKLSVEAMVHQLGIADGSITETIENNRLIYLTKGIIYGVSGVKKVCEFYLTGVTVPEDGDASVFVMSIYPEVDAAKFGAEGKKAVLAVNVTQ